MSALFFSEPYRFSCPHGRTNKDISVNFIYSIKLCIQLIVRPYAMENHRHL